MSPIDDSTFWSTWMQSPQVLDLSRRRRFTPELKGLFFSSLGLSAKSKVLDVGCGPGTFTRYLARYIESPGIIHGLDKDANFIAYARAQAKTERLDQRTSYYVDDALNLPFANDSFDAVVSYTVIEHIPDTTRFLIEQARVCKPSGRIAAMGVINTGNYSAPDAPVAGEKRYDTLLAKLGTVTEPLDAGRKIGKCFKIEDAPKLFETLGLKDITISGFYTPFCIDDASLSLQEKREQISGEYDEPLKQFIGFIKGSHPELLTEQTITSAEIDELLLLHARKYSGLLRDIENGKKTWQIEGSPSLIVSGRK